MPEERKTEESLVQDVEHKVVSSSPAAEDFLAIFLRTSHDNVDNVKCLFCLCVQMSLQCGKLQVK